MRKQEERNALPPADSEFERRKRMMHSEAVRLLAEIEAGSDLYMREESERRAKEAEKRRQERERRIGLGSERFGRLDNVRERAMLMQLESCRRDGERVALAPDVLTDLIGAYPSVHDELLNCEIVLSEAVTGMIGRLQTSVDREEARKGRQAAEFLLKLHSGGRLAVHYGLHVSGEEHERLTLAGAPGEPGDADGQREEIRALRQYILLQLNGQPLRFFTGDGKLRRLCGPTPLPMVTLPETLPV